MNRTRALVVAALLGLAASAPAVNRQDAVVAGEPATKDIDLGGNKVTNAGAATVGTDLVTKTQLDAAVPAQGVENIELTAAQTTITPSENLPTINLFGAPASLAGDVTYLARYNTSIDADFAAGTATGTIAAGSPVLAGGYLDTRGGVASAVGYSRQSNFPDHGTFDTFTIRAIVKMPASLPADGVYPIVDLPNYTSNCAVQATNVNRRVLLLQVAGGLPYFQLRIYAGNNVLSVNASWPIAGGFVPNQEYEVEGSSQQDPDNHRLFVDGVLRASNTNNPLGGNIYDGNNDVFYVGGEGGGTSCDGYPGGKSDLQIGGVALFNTIQHTASYTPTGLPGEGLTVEAIDTISTSGYSAGALLSIATLEPTRYTFAHQANPGPGQFFMLDEELFEPYSDRGLVIFQETSGFWTQLAEAPARVFGAVDVTAATHAASFDTPQIYTDTASNTVEVDLPACDAANDGRELRIREVDSTNDTVIDPNASENLNGSSTSYSFDTNSADGLSIRCKGTGSDIGWWSF
jgi:hypothetical protein